jgi:hypothetical protein
MANETNPKVSLGCGTLILIALIVLFLGNSNNDDKIVDEIRALRQQINRLEDQVKNQSETIRQLSSQQSEQRQPRARIVPPATPELETQPLPEN